MRSVIEFSAIVYHSQLNKFQTELLEKVQKRTLRTIFGFEKTYEELLKEAGIETLEARRQSALLKFAQKSLKNPKYSSWFPLKDNERQTRHTTPYEEEYARGNRLYNSPIFAMRRLLNGEQDYGIDTLFEEQ